MKKIETKKNLGENRELSDDIQNSVKIPGEFGEIYITFHKNIELGSIMEISFCTLTDLDASFMGPEYLAIDKSL